MTIRRIIIAPEHSATVPLWDDEGLLTEGFEFEISPNLRSRLVALQELWDSISDGNREGNLQIWAKYARDGREVKRDLQAELGPEFDVRLWLPDGVEIESA